MKNCFSKTLIALAVPTALVASSVFANETVQQDVFKSRFIVKYKQPSPSMMSANSTSRLTAESAMRSKTADISNDSSKDVEYIRAMALREFHVIGVKEQMSELEKSELITQLEQDPNIESVKEDRLLRAFSEPIDTHYSKQWHYFEDAAGLNLPNAWDKATGNGIVVAVLDTGYRPHADLVGNILPGYDMISDNFVANDSNGRDADARDPGDAIKKGACSSSPIYPDRDIESSWHGTHVAGTIAATKNGTGVVGVAYDSKVVPVRVLGRCGGLTSDIADGIIWAAGGSVPGVPNNQNPAKVINMSLGGEGTCEDETQAAIDFARSKGVTVIVAAGNSNRPASQFTPANCNGVVTVAALARDGSRASYSNYGETIDVAAPGGSMTKINDPDGILSTVDEGMEGPAGDAYAFSQGTSQAAPHVAGVAAMMYQLNPALTPTEVESILKSTSRADSCYNCGDGLVDAHAAVKRVSGDDDDDQPSSELENNKPVTGLKGKKGDELRFTFKIPAGAKNAAFKLTGGLGDADLYVQKAVAATTTSYVCKSENSKTSEKCTLATPEADTYHVLVSAYSDFEGATLVASYERSGSGTFNKTVNELSAFKGNWDDYTLDVPAGVSELKVKLSGGGGDVDLFVNYATEGRKLTYRCLSENEGTSETCTIVAPEEGEWFISLRAFSTYYGVTMNVSYQ